MTDHAATVRDALLVLPPQARKRADDALAALEQELAEVKRERDLARRATWKQDTRAEAAELALAEVSAAYEAAVVDQVALDAATKALRYMADYRLIGSEQTLHIDFQGIARAALDPKCDCGHRHDRDSCCTDCSCYLWTSAALAATEDTPEVEGLADDGTPL